MGKNRHSKDRLFLTATEWKGIGGKAKEASSSSSSLPFDHCALSLTRYETPCCTPEGGVIFDLLNIIPYIRKYKKNPISGETITTDDILRLTMSKNAEDKWHCPITFKVFNNNSKIVAVRTTGNVYSYEAVYELNIKTKNYVDLMNGEVFTKADIITLYDPTSPEMMKARDISSFVHLRQVREESKAEREGESSVRHNPATAFIMKEISNRQVSHPSKTYSELLASHKVEEFCEDVKRILDLQANTMDVSAGSTFTDQKASSSLTSSSVEAHTSNTTRLATVEEIRFAKWKVLRKVRSSFSFLFGAFFVNKIHF